MLENERQQMLSVQLYSQWDKVLVCGLGRTAVLVEPVADIQ
jgi:hypothetical protein